MALCWLTTLCAQEFGSHWIRIPQPDSLSHVWFRQTYVEDGLPLEARVTVASPGFYKLYVNECNVGTALFYPPRLQADSQPVAMTFDVTPFLRADTNVVALCYAPSYPHVDSSQVSVQFFGVDASGAPFSRFSDGGWLCRRANSRWTVDGKEHVDGRLHDASWKAAWFNPALWLTADERKAAEGAKVTYLSATILCSAMCIPTAIAISTVMVAACLTSLEWASTVWFASLCARRAVASVSVTMAWSMFVTVSSTNKRTPFSEWPITEGCG